jgi:hypothetical protein
LEKVRVAANEWELFWVAFGFTGFSGLEEFLVASGKDGLFFASEFITWGDVADRGVRAHL